MKGSRQNTMYVVKSTLAPMDSFLMNTVLVLTFSQKSVSYITLCDYFQDMIKQSVTGEQGELLGERTFHNLWM